MRVRTANTVRFSLRAISSFSGSKPEVPAAGDSPRASRADLRDVGLSFLRLQPELDQAAGRSVSSVHPA
jgi:hypothetical protein